MDFCQDGLSPSDPMFANIQPPRCKSCTSGITDHAPCAHFRFQWRSDSIRLRVKTIGLRSGVLDMCGRSIRFLSFCVCHAIPRGHSHHEAASFAERVAILQQDLEVVLSAIPNVFCWLHRVFLTPEKIFIYLMAFTLRSLTSQGII